MILWSIRACREARTIDGVWVSTEDGEIAELARAHGAQVVARPADLSGDDVYKQDVIVHSVDELERSGMRPEIVFSVQANSPELTGAILDEGTQALRSGGLWEIFSVDPRLVQNGAFRVMREPVVRQRTLSVHCGVIIADIIDVHTVEDVALVERRLQQRPGGARVPDL
jgi:cytidylyltransferase family protein